MADFVDRMVAELQELEQRRDALLIFMQQPEYNALPMVDRADLMEQYGYMNAYHVVLARRLVRIQRSRDAERDKKLSEGTV